MQCLQPIAGRRAEVVQLGWKVDLPEFPSRHFAQISAKPGAAALFPKFTSVTVFAANNHNYNANRS
jgi:hypothetical protein